MSAGVAGALVAFFIAVWPALDAFWTADDFVLLVRSRPADPASALRYFTTDWGGHRGQGGYYRPIVNLSLGWDSWLHGQSPLGFRATNLALHLACTLLVFRLARYRLQLSLGAASLAAALFLSHPLHDQAVLWMAGRTDVLSTLFYLLAFQLATSRPPVPTAAGVAAFLLALLSKEMAVTFPAVLLAYWLLMPRPEGADPPSRAVTRVLPFLLALAGYSLCRIAILGGLGGDSEFLRLGPGTLKSAAKLLLWSFVPWDLGPLKSALRGQPVLLYALSGLLLAACAVLAALSWRARAAVVSLAWVVVTLGPVYNRPAAWYVYLPSVGACCLLAVLIERHVKPRGLRLAVSAALVGGFLVGLQGNARTMAEAGRISRAAVDFFSRGEAPAYLLNAPMVLRGRVPILAGEAQYRAALLLAGRGGPVTPLNYVYLSDATTLRAKALVRGDTLETEVETDEDTFFTLDGPIPNPPAVAQAGQVFQGDHAVYRVASVDGQGKINHLVLTGVGEILRRGDLRLVEYREGQFRELAR